MLLIIIIIFALTTYATSALLGSPTVVFDLLVKAAADHPVSGNAGGSYLTMRSADGVVFFIIKYGSFDADLQTYS
jgi:Na+/proline symporter